MKATNLLVLKKNQKGLYEEVYDWMKSRKTTMTCFKHKDYIGGRIEIRRTGVSQNLTFFDKLADWRDSSSIIMV